MVTTRNNTNTKNRIRTPGHNKRKEGRFVIALHVKPLNKHNPKVDVVPVENPFIVEKSFLMQTTIFPVIEHIIKVVMKNETFRMRYEGYNWIDEVYGLKA